MNSMLISIIFIILEFEKYTISSSYCLALFIYHKKTYSLQRLHTFKHIARRLISFIKEQDLAALVHQIASKSVLELL